jgi:NDP-hexose 2,3-enoyl reductase
MEYTRQGRSGLSVSRLVLGTMNVGPETSETDSHAIMDRAHEHGINFVDTANVYGRRKGEGVTELRRRRRPGRGTCWVWSASSPSTTC